VAYTIINILLKKQIGINEKIKLIIMFVVDLVLGRLACICSCSQIMGPMF
jgi:hypothetical protein